MRNLASRLCLGLMVTALGLAAGCGGSGGGSSTPPPSTPAVTISPSGSQAIDQGQTLALTAAVSNDSAHAGVSWSVSGGGTLSGTTTAAVTYNAPATVTAATTATVTATSVTSASATATHTIVVNPAPAVTSNTTLTAAMVNTAYTATLTASGGAGALSWSVVTGSTLPAGLTLSSAGVLAGTPTAVGTSNFSVQVTDTSAAAPLSATAAMNLVVKPAPLTLPAPNPATLSGAATNALYSGTVVASGGVAGYTWTVNGAAVPANGTAVALTNGLGLSVSSDGSSTLSVSGTPSATGTVSLTAAVQDSSSATAGPNTYTINVAAGYAVKGQVRLTNVCGSTAGAGVTVSINTSPARTTTTDVNGNYAFAGVTNGAYTLTPSITGPSAAFSPATLAVTVASADTDFNYFNVDLGYTVSGTVAYAGAKSGRVYLTLTNSASGCGGVQGQGVSLAAPGAFTIHGVGPGTYALNARLETLGTGNENAADPTGTAANIAVSSADATGADVTLTDPAAVTLTAPTPQAIAEFNGGFLLGYSPATGSDGIETATSYTVQWSTSAAFTAVAGSQTFPANGTRKVIWLVNTPSLSNGSSFYFRVFASAPGAADSAPSTVYGPFTAGAPTNSDTVSGTVTFTGTASGPLYVVVHDPSSGLIYADYIKTPVSPQAYSIQIPSSTTSVVAAAILDQNNNGVADTGDLADILNTSSIAIAGATTTANLTLPSANSTATVTTQHNQNGPNSAQSLTSYGLTFEVDAGQKLPVEVTVVSGPNVAAPLDLGVCASCGGKFQYSFGLGAVVPQAGDSYGLKVTYSDATSETLTVPVTALVSELPANMTATGTSTTPTFTWTDPSDGNNYTYSFLLMDANGNTIWQIPGSASTATGFSSAITSIPWDTDPTGNGNLPSVGSLTTGEQYQWQIQLRDSQGNTSAWLVPFQP